MTTRGIDYLKKKKISHSVVTYDHQEKGAEFAALAANFPLSKTIKTLVVALEHKGFVLALLPGDQQLSLKKIAAACGCKRATMADQRSAERQTGYLVGGISPFGTKKKLPVVIDRSLNGSQEIMINAGQRGIMVKMDLDDVIRSLHATLADLAH